MGGTSPPRRSNPWIWQTRSEQKSDIAVNAVPKTKGQFLLFNKIQFGSLGFGGWLPPRCRNIARIFQKNHEIETIKNALEEIWFLTLIGLWHQDTIRWNMLLVTTWMGKTPPPTILSQPHFVALRFWVLGLRYDLPSKACLPANTNNKTNKEEKKIRPTEWILYYYPIYVLVILLYIQHK